MRKDISITIFGLIFFIWIGPLSQRGWIRVLSIFSEQRQIEENIQQIVKFGWVMILLFLSIYIIRALKTYFLFKMSPFLLLTYLVTLENFATFSRVVPIFEIELFWQITLTIILAALYYEYQRSYISLFPTPTINMFYDTLIDLTAVMALFYLPFIRESNYFYISNTSLFEIENYVFATFNIMFLMPIILILLSIPVIIDTKNYYGALLFKIMIILFIYLSSNSFDFLRNIGWNTTDKDIYQVFLYFLWIIVAITAAQLFRLSESTDKNL